jgi:hypothetical protein
MKIILLYFLLLVICIPVVAQKQKGKPFTRSATPDELNVPMQADHFTFKAGKVEFVEHKGTKAMKILPDAGQVSVKTVSFANGTIEYDIEPQDPRFAGIYFRKKDTNEAEYLYLRVEPATTNPLATDAVQYAPYIKGVLLWDLLPQFQGPAPMKANQWNHVKLVVSGKQLLVFVNDMNRAVLQIPYLEADVTEGGLSFEGAAVISNLVIKPNQTGELCSREGYDPTHNDPRYLRQWQISQPVALPNGQELFAGSLPKPETSWENIAAERQGLVNLTRKFGMSESRRVVWLKARLTADTDRATLLRLGFSDEVWVFINGQPLFVDKNIYRAPSMRKSPDGRLSIENTEFSIPLKQGANELLVGIANDFFGWGITARLEDLKGITIEH